MSQIRETVYMQCLHCARYTDLPPGTLSNDGTTETRICPDCEGKVVTVSYIVCTPNESTRPDL